MPEGDTVWRTCHRLHEALAGRRLLASDLRWPDIATADLRGMTVVEVVPRGKHILVRLDSGWTVHSHLRMDGQWRIEPTDPSAVFPGAVPGTPASRGDSVRAVLVAPEWTAVGSRLGMLDLVRTSEEHTLIGHLGPDILDPCLLYTSIAQLFAANSTAVPSGTMRTDTDNYDVQTGTTYASAKEIANLMLQGTDGPVRLGDLATVKEQPVETTSISRVDGKTSLTLSITKDPDANTVTVAHGVADKVTELTAQLGDDAQFVTVFDQAPYIEDSIHDLSVEGGIGLAMAVLVIMVFLGSIRPTLITAISIPLSLLIALIGLWVGGYTLNILTLGALTVAIGRVVDDSIVVIENIKRHPVSYTHRCV